MPTTKGYSATQSGNSSGSLHSRTPGVVRQCAAIESTRDKSCCGKNANRSIDVFKDCCAWSHQAASSCAHCFRAGQGATTRAILPFDGCDFGGSNCSTASHTL